MYRYGHPTIPQYTDRKFDRLQDAIDAAIDLQQYGFEQDKILRVYFDSGMGPLTECLIFEGKVWKPEE